MELIVVRPTCLDAYGSFTLHDKGPECFLSNSSIPFGELLGRGSCLSSFHPIIRILEPMQRFREYKITVNLRVSGRWRAGKCSLSPKCSDNGFKQVLDILFSGTVIPRELRGKAADHIS